MKAATTSLIVLMAALPLTAFRNLGVVPSVAGIPQGLRINEEFLSSASRVSPDVLKLDFPVIATYVSRKGDDFWRVCKSFGLNADLRDATRSSSNLQFLNLAEGTVLSIPNQKGTLYQVESPENLTAIANGFARGRAKNSPFAREILEANHYPLPDLADPEKRFAEGTVLFLPGALKPMGLPVPLLGRVSSGFGQRRHPVLGVVRQHQGLDIPKPYGTLVQASRKGVVTFAGWSGGYGMMVEVRHTLRAQGKTRVFYTRYGHLSKISVREGQSVAGGTILGRVGSTGISTGPHLHFEVRDDSGAARNPRNY